MAGRAQNAAQRQAHRLTLKLALSRAQSDLGLAKSAAHRQMLEQAIAAFQSFRSRFPRSALVGKAQLDLGWCYWLGGRIPGSLWSGCARG